MQKPFPADNGTTYKKTQAWNEQWIKSKQRTKSVHLE